MLGNHNLMTAVQTDTSFGRLSDIAKNTAGMVGYTNLTHRWNWGAAVQQVPYLSGGLSSGIGFRNGAFVQVDETAIVRQTSRGLTGIAAYPFSRARRVEFSSGYEQMSFDAEVNTIVTSMTTGQVLSDSRTATSLAQTLKLGTAGAATVFDNSVFGATSPVAGARYRLEATPTVGTIFFTGALADYRRYLAPVPFYTIATRLLHYGRYGSGAEDYRLPPLFVGYPQLVRGYDIGSFDTSECQATASSSCPAFDRLLGSRMLIGNVELRFPLLRPFGLRQNMYGPLPIEVALFGDGGVAWTSDETPTLFGGNRKPVASAGVTFRINLFGAARRRTSAAAAAPGVDVRVQLDARVLTTAEWCRSAGA
jgi:outer membrane protein assembly factor BamA